MAAGVCLWFICDDPSSESGTLRVRSFEQTESTRVKLTYLIYKVKIPFIIARLSWCSRRVCLHLFPCGKAGDRNGRIIRPNPVKSTSFKVYASLFYFNLYKGLKGGRKGVVICARDFAQEVAVLLRCCCCGLACLADNSSAFLYVLTRQHQCSTRHESVCSLFSCVTSRAPVRTL